jgi:outer membrane protein assembly factor BamA
MAKRLTYLLITSIFLAACSNTKFLPKGQKLYTGSEVKIEDNSINKSEANALRTELNDLVRPKPNSNILGLRIKLWIYNKTRTTKTKGLRHYLNTKLGEPPVYASAVDLEKNSQIIQNRLQNVSYFQAQVTGDTISKGKTATAVFTAITGPSYHYRKIVFPQGKDNLDTAVAGTAKSSFLKIGAKYNLDVIKNERLRIDARLKEEGFYYFSPEALILRVDSTITGHQVDAFVTVKPETVDKARRIYTINNIYVYPSYSLRDTALRLDQTVKYRWYNVIDPKNSVRPFVFKNSVLLHPGDTYNRTAHNNSLSRFIDLGPWKYVKNRFEDVSTDSSKLDIYYFLTKYPKKSLQFEFDARTTSADYNGTEIRFNIKNRNTFKGAELFKLSFFVSSDGQVSGNYGGYAVTQYGTEATLSWPRFISPWDFKTNNAYIPRTNLSAGFSIVERSQLYTLHSYNGSFGYQWKKDTHKEEELKPIDITFVNPFNVTQLYIDSIKKTHNPALVHTIAKQFTIGSSYSYNYSNTLDNYRTNTWYYNGKISGSGNLLGLITGADTLNGKVSTLFGAAFNQYLKLENEIRYYHKVGPNSRIAARLFTGFGLPYGNSTIVPYSQQFFIGGPNSLRGFRARSVGPGTVDPYKFVGDSGFLPDQSGDIKLEANLEYRPKLFSIVYGALFVDAGNIWNLNSHYGLEGGTFGKNFLTQLAADVGFGLRFDVQVFTLRTDLGIPIRTPYGDKSVHWQWNDRVFNLAIGYPF